MNSDPNSDSEQCTKSKLGRVHSAHTHGPGCAHSAVSWHALGCIVAPSSAVSRLCSAVSCRCTYARVGSPCRSDAAFTLSHDTRNCIATQSLPHAVSRALPHVSLLSAPCRRALRSSIAALVTMCRDTRFAPPVTIHPFVSRHTPQRPSHARARAARSTHRPTVSQGLLVMS